jgi:AcrR family transcriptional regulator
MQVVNSRMSKKGKHASAGGAEREDELRRRIRRATFELLTKRGYAGTSTLEIATRAKVSKRELYTLFRDKHAILASCIAERVKAMQTPLQLPPVRDPAGLKKVLASFGATALRTLSHPAVSAMFRLAMTESERSPEVARTLDAIGRGPTSQVLIAFLSQAQSEGLLDRTEPSVMAEQFFALLWGGLRLRLLLRLEAPPNEEEIERRAQLATDAFLRLHARG